MAHEIESTDTLVLNSNQPAWHGMGIVLNQDLSPQEACKLAFPWQADQQDVFTLNPAGVYEPILGHKMNVRSDNGQRLGLVSSDYKIIQPKDVADFASALAADSSVKVQVETAGSIQGGKRMWILLKGDAFDVANNDTIFPYVLLSNGFDGSSSFRITPTTIRAVCSNTLHASIPRVDLGELGKSAIVIRHTADALNRVEEARKALAGYSMAIEKTKQVMGLLSSKGVTKEQVNQFFIDSYTEDFGGIPANPQNKAEERQRDRATSAYRSFSKRFDDERVLAGSTWWNVANSYSGLIQHDMKARGANDQARVEKRVESNLFGLNADRTHAAFSRAFRGAISG